MYPLSFRMASTFLFDWLNNIPCIYLKKCLKMQTVIFWKLFAFPKGFFFFLAKMLNQISCIYIKNKVE